MTMSVENTIIETNEVEKLEKKIWLVAIKFLR